MLYILVQLWGLFLVAKQRHLSALFDLRFDQFLRPESLHLVGIGHERFHGRCLLDVLEHVSDVFPHVEPVQESVLHKREHHRGMPCALV